MTVLLCPLSQPSAKTNVSPPTFDAFPASFSFAALDYRKILRQHFLRFPLCPNVCKIWRFAHLFLQLLNWTNCSILLQQKLFALKKLSLPRTNKLISFSNHPSLSRLGSKTTHTVTHRKARDNNGLTWVSWAPFIFPWCLLITACFLQNYCSLYWYWHGAESWLACHAYDWNAWNLC